MGLDIFSNDGTKEFYIGYVSFAHMRGLFASYYDKSFYNRFLMKEDDILCKEVGDLCILLNHSDADGELTSNQCQRLLPCLHIDEGIINSLCQNGYILKLMYDFKELIRYCAENPDVKLIFG